MLVVSVCMYVYMFIHYKTGGVRMVLWQPAVEHSDINSYLILILFVSTQVSKVYCITVTVVYIMSYLYIIVISEV